MEDIQINEEALERNLQRSRGLKRQKEQNKVRKAIQGYFREVINNFNNWRKWMILSDLDLKYYLQRFNTKAAALTFITLFLLAVGIVKFPFYLLWSFFVFVAVVYISVVTKFLYSMFESFLEHSEK